MYVIIDIIIYLFIYSFLGWCCETVYCSFGAGRFVNRGFLNGPFCPVYGFGAVFTILALHSFESTLTVFFFGMIITSTLEYITAFMMEKFFNAKWWDYSNKRFNIHGRVCLLNSTLFGFLCIFLMFDIHPLISGVVATFNFDFKLGFTCALMMYFVADATVTIISVLGINKRLALIWTIKNDLMEAYHMVNDKLEIEQMIEVLQNKNIYDERIKLLKEKISGSGTMQKRLLRAFPSLSSLKHNESLAAVKKSIKNKMNKDRSIK